MGKRFEQILHQRRPVHGVPFVLVCKQMLSVITHQGNPTITPRGATTLRRMAGLKRLMMPSAEEDLEALEVLWMASGNVKQYNHSGKVSSTGKHAFIIILSNSLTQTK